MIAMRAVPAWGLRPLLQRRDFPPLHLIRLTNSSDVARADSRKQQQRTAEHPDRRRTSGAAGGDRG